MRRCRLSSRDVSALGLWAPLGCNPQWADHGTVLRRLKRALLTRRYCSNKAPVTNRVPSRFVGQWIIITSSFVAKASILCKVIIKLLVLLVSCRTRDGDGDGVGDGGCGNLTYLLEIDLTQTNAEKIFHILNQRCRVKTFSWIWKCDVGTIRNPLQLIDKISMIIITPAFVAKPTLVSGLNAEMPPNWNNVTISYVHRMLPIASKQYNIEYV